MTITHEFSLTHEAPDHWIDLKTFLHVRGLVMIITCQRIATIDSESTRKVTSLSAFGYFTGDLYDLNISQTSVLFRQKSVHLHSEDVKLTVEIFDPIELHYQASTLGETVKNLADQMMKMKEEISQMQRLLDSPYMPGCVDGFREIVSKLEQNDKSSHQEFCHSVDSVEDLEQPSMVQFPLLVQNEDKPQA